MRPKEPTKFTLHIELGNAEMQDCSQIAAVLRKAADQVDGGWSGRPILDANGNLVGRWELR